MGRIVRRWLSSAAAFRYPIAQGVPWSIVGAGLFDEDVDAEKEWNKQTALDFLDLMFNQCRPADAIEEDAATPYIQHNPEVADGKQAFID